MIPTIGLLPYLTRVVVLAALMLAGAEAFEARYRIGVQAASDRCLPYSVWLYDLDDEALERGAFYAYRARGLAPLLADGQVIIKQLAALPGDRFTVRDGRAFVNGRTVAELNPAVLDAVHRTAADTARDAVLRADQLALLGTLPGSYDARYTGPIARDQVLGRAYPLW